MQLILVRHPLPAVAPGLCYGSSDIEVDQAALQAALAAIVDAVPRALPIFSSPLRRCSALSIPLAARLGQPSPIFDARLGEMDFGTWEMRSWDSIPRDEIDAWSSDLVHLAPGGGETVLQVVTRVAAFLDEVCTQAGAIVVCHAGTIRILRALQQARAGATLEDVAFTAASTVHRIDYASVVPLQF